jgi:hypothetical protein
LRIGFGYVVGIATVLASTACGAGVGPVPRMPIDAFTNVEAPATAVKGRPVTVTLSLWNSNSCTGGPQARAVVDEATRTVTFTGDVGSARPDAVCLQAVTHTALPATFTPAQTGGYTLKMRLLPRASDRRGYAHVNPPLDPRVHTGPQDVTLTLQVTE